MTQATRKLLFRIGGIAIIVAALVFVAVAVWTLVEAIIRVVLLGD